MPDLMAQAVSVPRAAAVTGVAAGAAASGAAAGLLALGSRRRRTRRDTDPLGARAARTAPRPVTTSDGLTLHAEVDEPTRRRRGEATLVLVHGYALNLDCWVRQRRHLHGRRRMVLYDQRSHGRSERADPASCSMERLGQDLREVIDALAPDEPVVLVGHSMGGMTILSLAAQAPELFGERVVGVGLVSSAADQLRPYSLGMRGLPGAMLAWLGAPVTGTLARMPGLVDGTRRGGAEVEYLLTRRLAFGGDPPAEQVQLLNAMLTQTPYAVIASFVPALDALDQTVGLPTVGRVPTAVVCGTEDRLTPVRLSRDLARRVPGARMVEVPGAGHLVLLEAAEQVNRVLDELAVAAGGTMSR